MADRPEQPKFVGARIARFEDQRLLSGRARFIDDITPPGTRHLAFVRAQLAHAKIVTVDNDYFATAICRQPKHILDKRIDPLALIKDRDHYRKCFHED